VKESPTIDKTKWGRGPWQKEPDRFEWKHKGFPCLAVRHPRMGQWCGYVAVPPGHPYYEKPCDECADIDVHGGLTYADHCNRHICHVPAPGEPDDVWWLGFDCAHAGDVIPSMNEFIPKGITCMTVKSPFGETYKTLRYVVNEVNNLAHQLAKK
jgi:hypothetical protein